MHESMRKRTIDTLKWMIADMRWRADETKRNFEDLSLKKALLGVGNG